MLEKFLSKKRAKMMNRLIPPSHRKGRILDIGCGAYPYFLINTQFNEKYGIDRLTENEIKTKEILIKNGDIAKEGLRYFENEYFDVVTMSAVFEHIDQGALPGLIKDIKRALKPNGVFIITTPAPWSNVILRVLSTLKLVNQKMIEEHKTLYSARQITSILSDAGFSKECMRFGKFELCMNTWAVAINSNAKRSR